MRTGVLIVNLGTPRSPRPVDVGRYLREFLMDPWVIDIPYPARWLLVQALIVPRRAYASGKLYEKIWTPEGSPLLVHTVNLAKGLQSELGENFVVRPAMRYGAPSIRSALEAFAQDGIEKLLAWPLYPQYSLAATKSSQQEIDRWADVFLPGVPRAIAPAFYDRKEYLDAVAEVSRPHIIGADRVLFSFHGLPARQVKKTDRSGRHCLAAANCCDQVTPANRDCYRAQSFHTARELASRLGLEKGKWDVGFQSRLGRTPWIEPFSDVLYESLPKQGVKKLAVLTPSFVADCLETLEEVQLRGEQAFKAAGGESLKLVPSLNSHPAWVRALAAKTRAF